MYIALSMTFFIYENPQQVNGISHYILSHRNSQSMHCVVLGKQFDFVSTRRCKYLNCLPSSTNNYLWNEFDFISFTAFSFIYISIQYFMVEQKPLHLKDLGVFNVSIQNMRKWTRPISYKKDMLHSISPYYIAEL